MKQSFRKIIFIVLFILPSFVLADSDRPKVCLNMIVKNEKDVIVRCLTSVLPIIDYWVIVDTGSTDGTQEIIKNFMAKNAVPGELHESPWVNFSHNRNEALKFADEKADYVLFIDADEYLEYEADFKLPPLDKDYYYIMISHSGSKYCRIQLINNHLDWEWKGVLHEAISCPVSKSHATLEKILNIYTSEGARSKDPQKYHKDAQILEDALKKEPHNSRYIFYLAQSYRDAGCYSKALENYEKRAALGGWNEEVFWSLYQIGVMEELLEMPFEKVLASYQRAYQYRNSRIEPLYQIAHYLGLKGDFKLGYEMAKIALAVPTTTDILFVQDWMREYGILLELSISAYWIGKYEESQQISLELLKNKNLPPNVRACVENNLGFANAKLLEKICNQVILSDRAVANQAAEQASPR
ncbi:tetratricopeptide repeat-containing glycosyltransferase [Parachlamydia acanthamoebae]|uniref:tetratricopeptide repeat-containing glycosyltransferase n=1 Tax=Parachlamydia acanthamoebae TaxID=83552 RepID=UPI00075129D9|nr:glycosyltransferase [Parachlamydia acanthamoebae]